MSRTQFEYKPDVASFPVRAILWSFYAKKTPLSQISIQNSEIYIVIKMRSTPNGKCLKKWQMVRNSVLNYDDELRWPASR